MIWEAGGRRQYHGNRPAYSMLDLFDGELVAMFFKECAVLGERLAYRFVFAIEKPNLTVNDTVGHPMAVVEIHDNADDAVGENAVERVRVILDGVINIKFKQIVFHPKCMSHDSFGIPTCCRDVVRRIFRAAFHAGFLQEHA